MSNESIQANNPSLMKELGSSVAFSGAISGFGALSSVARNRGIKGAVNSLARDEFKALDASLKASGSDVFSRSIRLSQNYDSFKGTYKSLSKARNMLNKAGDGLSISETIKNFFRSADKKVTVADIQKKIDAAETAVNTAKKTLTSGGGDLITEAAESAAKNLDAIKAAGKTGKELQAAQKAADAAETAAKMASGSTLNTAGNLFKSELKNKFVLGVTIMAALPRIKEEIIPAFKEKGVWEGIKTTGKVIVRTGADFVSNAGFSAIGRAIGSAVGTFFCPGAGTAVGGMFGDVIGSFFSMKFISKIFDKNKNKDKDLAAETVDAQAQSAQNQQMIKQYEQLTPEQRAKIQQLAQQQMMAQGAQSNFVA